jgi:hypothetical protein
MSVKADIWVSAYRRRCELAAMPVVIVRKGAPEAGSMFVVIRMSPTTRFGSWGHRPGRCWTKQANDSSNLASTAPRPQKEIDEYLARQAGYDP